MQRVKRMQPVLRIAELEADKAGRMLAMAQQRLLAEQQKLTQLGDYQQDYRERLQSAGKQGMSVDRLRLFDGFNRQLDNAMTHQKTVIAHFEQEVAACHRKWQQLDIRHKSLEKMLGRLQLEAEKAQARNEQRNHDEYARRRPGGGWR
ncbi:MAG TPA: flagellar export protein FliJ [Pseudohongiella sp.]|nr:flagellar export protein FliJ [Pseudohongiella sp.]|tara:strand:- start:39 stop:482 length:444 start_codon:yes stop_codon:yes gene_type:complete